jgi:hypothetical protein
MVEIINELDEWHFQTFRPLKVLDRKLRNQRSFTHEEMEKLEKLAQKLSKKSGVRS